MSIYSEELNEYKTSIQNIIQSIEEKIVINNKSYYQKNKDNLINKFEAIISLMIDSIKKKDLEIKNLNDQNEILLYYKKANERKNNLVKYFNLNDEENNRTYFPIKRRRIATNFVQQKNKVQNKKINDISSNY